MRRSITALGLLGLMSATAQADHETHNRSLQRSPITPFVAGSLHFGGDTLASASNGFEDTDLDAGGGIAARLGINFAASPELEMEASLGIKFNRIDADDGDASVVSFPIDGLVFARVNEHRFGAGIAVHLAPEFEIDSSNGSGTVEFDDAVGWILQYDYQTSPNFRVGVRYTGIDYEVDDESFDASNFSIFGIFYFY